MRAAHGIELVNAGHVEPSSATSSPEGSLNPLAEVIVRRHVAVVGKEMSARPCRASKNGSRVISDGEIVVKRRVRYGYRARMAAACRAGSKIRSWRAVANFCESNAAASDEVGKHETHE